MFRTRTFNFAERYLGVPTAMGLLGTSVVLLALGALKERFSIWEFAQAGIAALLALLLLFHFRSRKNSGRGREALKKALSAVESANRDPETVIALGAKRFPEIEEAHLVAQPPGSKIEPLILASAGSNIPPIDEIRKAVQNPADSSSWKAFTIPSWPGFPQYSIVVSLRSPLLKEQQEQLETYAQLAGGFLASGTAMREYSLAQTRMNELESQMQVARQRILREARNTLMGKLVSNIAHELNNPLAAVLGATQLLRQREKDPMLLTLVESLEKETRRCKEIVDQVTGLSEHNLEEAERIDVHQTLEEAFNLLLYRLRREQIELKKSFCEENLIFEGDESLFQQALLNLGNAMVELLAGAQKKLTLCVSSSAEQGKFKIRLNASNETPIAKTQLDRPGIRLSLWVASAILEEAGGKLDLAGLSQPAAEIQIVFSQKASARKVHAI